MSHYDKHLTDTAKGVVKKCETTINSCQGLAASCSTGGHFIEKCSANAGRVIAALTECDQACQALKKLADEHFKRCDYAPCRALLDDCYEACNDITTISAKVIKEIREADANESARLCTECVEICNRCAEVCSKIADLA